MPDPKPSEWAREKAEEFVNVNHDCGFAFVTDGPDNGNYILDFGDRHQRMQTFVHKLHATIALALDAAIAERDEAIRVLAEEVYVRRDFSGHCIDNPQANPGNCFGTPAELSAAHFAVNANPMARAAIERGNK